jgi:hypothetical protein
VSWCGAHDPQHIGIPNAPALDLLCHHAFALQRDLIV